MSKKKRIQKTYSPEFRDRAIRMVMEQQSKYRSQWAAIESIAEKVGCGPPTLHGWIKKREANTTEPGALSSAERDRLKELEREVKELKTANEILRKASAFLAGRPSDRWSSTGRPSCADPNNGGLHQRTS